MTEQGTLFGDDGPRALRWFRAGKNTPRAQQRNVARGLHPLGIGLSETPGALCGNCAFWIVEWHKVRCYPKCGRMVDAGTSTRGPGTDIRARWRGCAAWVVAPPGTSVPRKRPGAVPVASPCAEASGTIRPPNPTEATTHDAAEPL